LRERESLWTNLSYEKKKNALSFPLETLGPPSPKRGKYIGRQCQNHRNAGAGSAWPLYGLIEPCIGVRPIINNLQECSTMVFVGTTLGDEVDLCDAAP
jgi:hypothetical protein